MLLQAESIQQFVEPCTHWVIINDPVVVLSEWETALSPYYTQHTLRLISIDQSSYSTWVGEAFKVSNDGWQKQQLCKFLIYKFIKDDYLILDSKNFFIKPCNINEWESITGCGFLEAYTIKGNTWLPTIDVYSNYFKCSINYTHLAMQTPFVFRKEILDKIDNFDTFLNWFNEQEVLPSEFILYSILAETHQQLDRPHMHEMSAKHFTIWSKHNFEYFMRVSHTYSKDHIKVAGLHRGFLSKLDEIEQFKIQTWIFNLGLTTRLF